VREWHGSEESPESPSHVSRLAESCFEKRERKVVNPEAELPLDVRVTDLVDLEELVEQRVLRDWRDAGEALERIRDERLYEPEYRSFKAYIEGRYQIHR
jgi:hypothetical protein